MTPKKKAKERPVRIPKGYKILGNAVRALEDFENSHGCIEPSELSPKALALHERHRREIDSYRMYLVNLALALYGRSN